jgi:hypothetical protein
MTAFVIGLFMIGLFFVLLLPVRMWCPSLRRTEIVTHA